MKPIPLSSCTIRNSRFCIPFVVHALVLLLLPFLPPACSCTEQDKHSLLQFLAGLSQDGSLAASWRLDVHCYSAWEGISCDVDGTVTEVSLPSRGLHGRISPSSLANLPGLTHLNLSNNALSGGLPPELMSSTSLLVLDVSFNRLDGALPPPWPLTTGLKLPLKVLNISSNQFAAEFPTNSSWSVLANLVTLNASNNSFTGQMPVELLCSASPPLAELDLSDNRFTGEVSPAVANCTMLKVLNAAHNKLSGTLPVELFDVTSLEHLSFADYGLQGELDGAHMAKLTNLVTLDLGENSFHGEILESICQLKKLEELRLCNNNMSGDLPSSLGNCTRLTTIDLKINNFSGDLGKFDFSALHNLKILDLMRNNFSGVIPESIYSCSNLTALRLSSNHIHGEISSRIGDLKHLTFLSLTRNSFTNIAKAFHVLKSSRNITSLFIGLNFMDEAIPQDGTMDGFENLQYLTLRTCSLTGKIPHWLAKLKKLKVLDLANNQLIGPMPSWINYLTNLFHLDVSNNSLTGQIPVTLMEMPMLKLDNFVAHLTRLFDLPVYRISVLRQYRALTSFPALLNLSTNKFTGVIPQEIGELTALSQLDFIM